MAPHHNTMSCDPETAWPAGRDSGSISCWHFHPPQTQICPLSCKSHQLADATSHTFPVVQERFLSEPHNKHKLIIHQVNWFLICTNHMTLQYIATFHVFQAIFTDVQLRKPVNKRQTCSYGTRNIFHYTCMENNLQTI